MRPTRSSTDSTAGGRLPVGEIRGRLLGHYDLHRRELPWRGETDPYRIWISEVMLQQTRVETVIPYYKRWMERFPDLQTLALADEDDVLSAWEGLGYYARARNAHRAARMMRERHDGQLPSELAALRSLPGFGAYTAGAVASIAFGARAPAIDGNVRRVLSRLLDLPAPSASELATHAGRLLDPERPGDSNQALMDLGATVCTPRTPRCDTCPLHPECLAAARGTVSARPESRPRRGVPQRSFLVTVLLDARGRTLLIRRPPTGLLGGMWAFPEREVSGGPTEDVTAGQSEHHRLPEVRHAFTHFRARYLPWVLRAEGVEISGPAERRWVPPSEPGVALPAAQKRIMASLIEWLESDRNRG
jgi:A/G-specific adenine glycosylase